MNPTEIVGWASSVILVLTIGKQVYKQWREGSSEGVSIWLFVGQMAASLGFTIYSWLVGNMVFVVTNSLMLLNALVGYGIVRHHRKRERQQQQQQGASSATAGKLEAEQA
jgi:MtN3 and saliva related transmembrane protein